MLKRKTPLRAKGGFKRPTIEQTAAALQLMVHDLEQRGRADAEELARLKEQLGEPTPIPERPRTS